MNYLRSSLFSTGYPQVFTDIHRKKATHRSVDFPCFCGSLSFKPFTFKASRPVDNLPCFQNTIPAPIRLLTGTESLIHNQYTKTTVPLHHRKRSATGDGSFCQIIYLQINLKRIKRRFGNKPSTIHPQAELKARNQAMSLNCG